MRRNRAVHENLQTQRLYMRPTSTMVFERDHFLRLIVGHQTSAMSVQVNHFGILEVLQVQDIWWIGAHGMPVYLDFWQLLRFDARREREEACAPYTIHPFVAYDDQKEDESEDDEQGGTGYDNDEHPIGVFYPFVSRLIGYVHANVAGRIDGEQASITARHHSWGTNVFAGPWSNNTSAINCVHVTRQCSRLDDPSTWCCRGTIGDTRREFHGRLRRCQFRLCGAPWIHRRRWCGQRLASDVEVLAFARFSGQFFPPAETFKRAQSKVGCFRRLWEKNPDDRQVGFFRNIAF